MRRIRYGVWVAAAGPLLASGASAQVADREKIIDITELREAMQKAAAPMAERIRSTTLKERFERVVAVLQQPDVQESELLEALQALRGEIDAFTTGWSEVEDPLWEGQESIGRTIDRIRAMLAKGTAEEPSGEVAEKVAGYDTRLTDLARAIQGEQDDVRKRRLKTLFANTLSLRKLVEMHGRFDLRPTSQGMLGQLVKALMHLEDQLTTATFQVERARIVLGQTGEFITGYIAIVEDLVQAEALARMLAEMQETGTGVGAVVAEMGLLTQDVEQFASLMEGFMSRIAFQIEAEAIKIAGNFEAQNFQSLDVDAEIQRYLNFPNNPTR
jgi:hypothetical protein